MSVSGRILRWPGSITSLFAGANFEQESNSLFLEILDWMLAPLLLLWPISIALTNHYAHQIADQPYDAALVETVQVVSRIVESSPWPLPDYLPHSAQLMLTGNGVDSRFFRISSAPPKVRSQISPLSSEFVAEVPSPVLDRAMTPVPLAFDTGNAEIPLSFEQSLQLSKGVLLRDDTVGGETVRVAYRAVRVGALPDGKVMVVQVAETRNEREALVTRIIRGVLLPQFALIPLVAILSYLG